MKLVLIVLAVLFACAFACWCFCRTAGDADRNAEAAAERFERRGNRND